MASFLSISLLTIVISLYTRIHCNAQPIYVYDGVSTVDIIGQYNWTLQYPLGVLCEDPSWVKTLTIDVTCASKQCDLVMAFGTSSTYFAIVIAYDGAVWVPLGNNELGEPKRQGALFVTPPSGLPLREATTTLEAQYATSNDFRTSLIEDQSQTDNWELLVEADDAMAVNSDRLVLRILGDRENDITHLTVTKNNVTATISMGSTWNPWSDNVNYFLGCDKGNGETYVLSGIQSVDECTWDAAPTPPTTAVTTLSPTIGTDAPSQYPSIQSMDPTLSPSKSPSLKPSVTPIISPSKSPISTLSPTQSHLPSGDPTTAPYKVSVDTESHTSAPVSVSGSTRASDTTAMGQTRASDGNVVSDVEVYSADSKEGESAAGTVLGVKVLYWIIIGIVVLVLLIIVVVFVCWKCNKRKGQYRIDDYDPDDTL